MVVVAGDGQVPHPAVVDLWRGAAVGGGEAAVGSLEVLTFRQLVRRNPRVQIPEEVG